MTGFLTCESKPRDQSQRNMLGRRMLTFPHIGLRIQTKLKQNNKTARPTNITIGTKNVGKAQLRKVWKAVHKGRFHNVLPNKPTKPKIL